MCEDRLVYDDIVRACVPRSSTCGGYMRVILPDSPAVTREVQGETDVYYRLFPSP